MNKAAFLDRDGVINIHAPDGGYVTRWEDIQVVPGVTNAITLLNKAGFRVIVVTNQRCVAKGLISTVALEAMHERLGAELAAMGARIDAIYFCPHEKVLRCPCRKPAPGMLLAAAHVHSIDLSSSWMIGDSEIDIEAGKRAGCRTARVLSESQGDIINSDVLGTSLLDIVEQLLGLDGRTAR
jgi:D-glycero-D-manno-heptose 1,7-bisphosphate phosphatase